MWGLLEGLLTFSTIHSHCCLFPTSTQVIWLQDRTSWLTWLPPRCTLSSSPHWDVNVSSRRWPDSLRWMVSAGIPYPSHSLCVPSISQWIQGDCIHRYCTHNFVLLCALLANLIVPFGPSLVPAVVSTSAGLCFLVRCTVAPAGTPPDCLSYFACGWRSGRGQFSPHPSDESTGFGSSDLGWGA